MDKNGAVKSHLDFYAHKPYRVRHIALTFLIRHKMTMKCIVQMKARHFYNHIDPHFDMEHQLMSADPYPVTKLT